MIRVIVNGAKGNMGRTTVQAISDDPGLTCVASCDVDTPLAAAMAHTSPQVVVDFTRPEGVFENAKTVLRAGVAAVIGTTGLSQDELRQLDALAREQGTGIAVCPNFAIGAILMMQFAAKAARYMDTVEIIEYHHPQKADAPSGTAIKTVDMMMASHPRVNADAMGLQQTERIAGSKGGYYHNVPIHSVRLNGYLASQDVIFGAAGQRLVIRHDSLDRSSFMPGVCLAIKKVLSVRGLVYGLEHFIDD
jgi:4-hydroxy-tetrahydrodipicolinate reductase